jgi:outer membrane protein assembly factor BamB
LAELCDQGDYVVLVDSALGALLRHSISAIGVLLGISIGLGAFPAACGEWPEFRGPFANGWVESRGLSKKSGELGLPESLSGRNFSDLPVEWSQSKNVDWRCELPGQGWSSPVVSGKVIYLTAAIAESSGGYRLVLLMVDADTGSLLNQVDLFEQPADAPGIHQKNSHASPTPFIDSGKIFLHFGHQGTACCNLDGEVLWSNNRLWYPPVHGNGGSPVVAGDLLIFSRDGGNINQVTALDKTTGELVWTSQRNVETDKRFSFCTPLLIEHHGTRQLIIPGSDVVQSLDPLSGDELWRVNYSGYSVVPRPLFHQGLVFICTGYMRPQLLAIDPSGNGDVTQTHVKWSTDATVPKTPSLIGWNSAVIMISDNGVCTCLETHSGAPLWKKRLGGDYSASPILSANRLYCISEAGVCTVVDIGGEQPDIISVNDLEERTLASPSVIGDSLLIRTAQALYRISN